MEQQEKQTKNGSKELKSLVSKVALCNSQHFSHHFSLVIANKDDKIKELQKEIDELQNYRIENDLLKDKVAKMEERVAEYKTLISQFDYSKTIARKVEKDKYGIMILHFRRIFLDQLVKKKRSTDPADSSHYVHISKYHKLKDNLISEKCK